MTSSRLLRREAASTYLKQTWGVVRAPTTLAKLAVRGGGPPFRRDGRVPLYSTDDLDQWVSSRLGALMHSTTDGAAASLNTTPQPREATASGEQGGAS
jgi:hypothetical protein